jgi:hypothetical protein
MITLVGAALAAIFSYVIFAAKAALTIENRGRATAFHERFSASPKPHSLHCLR